MRLRLVCAALLAASCSEPVDEAADGAARVHLPSRARGAVRVEDVASGVEVRFVLRDVRDTPIERTGRAAIYRGAVGGADLSYRVHGDGAEDLVHFAERPAVESLVYDLDVRRVAGLRLVDGMLELLDRGGAPRLRVARPWVVEAGGAVRAARLDVEGCAYDVDPAAPWGRPVTPPGAARCAMRVAWSDVRYPAVVDPIWTTTGAMTAPRTLHSATVLRSGRVLVAGGFGMVSGSTTAAELYDPASSTFAATGPLGTGRQSHGASLLPSGKVLLTGGRDDGEATAGAEVYDPDRGTFAVAAPMASARWGHTSTSLGSGKVLVAGGVGARSAPLAAAELYDEGTRTFVPTSALTTSRYLHTANVLASGKVLLVGGVAGSSFEGVLATAELYDPGAGTFAATGTMADARAFHAAATLLSGKVLVVGGGGADARTAEVYDPGPGTFSATGAMATARTVHGAVTLLTGRVLVAGGNVAGAEIYDPGAGTFSSAGSLAVARPSLTASLLPSGKVLIVGGAGTSAELYAPAQGEPCTAGAQCPSGTCVDGVCCDRPCAAQCEACDVGPPGTCVTVVGPPHGARAACAEGLVCTARSAERCLRSEGSTCDGDHTTIAEDGSTQSCAPYRCRDDGSCRAACVSVADCVPPAVCDGSGACVPRPSDDDDDGCSAAPSSPRGWLVAAALLVLVRKRRRSAR